VSIPTTSIHFVLCRVWHADAVCAEHPFAHVPTPAASGAAGLQGCASLGLVACEQPVPGNKSDSNPVPL